MRGEEILQSFIVARDELLSMIYGLIRDIDELRPEERTSDFLRRNLKARVENYVSRSDPDSVIVQQMQKRLDELHYESFPMKQKDPTSVPPSSLPDLGDQ